MVSQSRLNAFLLTVVVTALALVTAMRLWLGQRLPMWLDETWTAIIARQPSWGDFWREAWLDCNPPFYYFVMWLLHGVAGESNWALRIPSIVFVTAAGLLPVFWRPNGLSREASLTWAALICLWWPGLAISLDARAYGLLLLISVAQAIAFAKLLEKPDTRHALLWGALGGLAVLSHYYAACVVAAQGLIFVAARRPHWFKLWPAALVGVAVCAWLAYHAPRLAEYARPDVIWYEPTTFVEAVEYAAYVVGFHKPIFLLLLAGILAITIVRRPPEKTSLSLVSASGLVAFAIAIVLGVLKPSLTGRYMTPMAPLFLLGIVLIVRRSPTACMALVGLYFAFVINPMDHAGRLASRAGYGYQREAEWLMEARPDQIIFFWDHPAAKILDRGSLRQIGGFFFERAGMAVTTKEIVLKPGEDPNIVLRRAADGNRPALLWLYNSARGSASKDFPPKPIPGWRCKHRSRGPVGLMACAPAKQFPQP